MEKYKFNKDKLEFVEEKRGAGWWLKRIFQYFLATVVLAILYYIVFSLVFSTDQERKIACENRIMEQEYERMQEKLELLDNTVSNLKYKDREIYRSIFNAEPRLFLPPKVGFSEILTGAGEVFFFLNISNKLIYSASFSRSSTGQ